MMKRILPTFLFCGALLMLGVTILVLGPKMWPVAAPELLSDASEAARIGCTRTNMPPGYHLMFQEATGRYRPVYAKSGDPVFWVADGGTKQEAINRAWRQHDYEVGWERVD